ncbi:MAG: TatD family hydrolase [Candidatus Zambryskibacteria bacterium]|nr:TatD family hydrolase [Candidatus Zambryskibacteria bacterium]
MNYIDIHCHLDMDEFDADRQEVLARMKEGGVVAISVGSNLEASKKAIEIAETNENIWTCVGVHPEEISKGIFWDRGSSKMPFDISEFKKLVKSSKVVGIGECGLDFFRLDPAFAKATADKQKELFESQIQFAIKNNKPLMLHIRRAYDDALDILNNYKKNYGEKLRGNVHFFTGNVEQTKRFLDLGFTMSFTGVITFTHDYDEVIKYIPQDSIMSETDAPFVTPVPHRGQRNEPSFVIEVVKRLTEIRGEDLETLSNAIIQNAKKVFDI